MGKLSKDDAIIQALKIGVDFDKDFHAQSYGNELSELAKETGYRKSRSASGSLGRAFFEHLERIYDKNPSYYKDMANDKYSLGGGIAIGGILGGYLGYKIGRARPQKSGFETEKKIGRKIKQTAKEVRGKKKMVKGGEVSELEYKSIYDILKEKIDDAVEELENTYEQSYQAKGEEVEHKSRDGFIAFTDGGYEKHWFEYVNILSGSGTSLPTKPLDNEMERQVEYAYESAKEDFIENNKELVEEIGEDKVNYHDLYELDKGDKAEELSEMERDMGDDSIYMKIEAFYFSPNNDRGQDGKHTIALSGDVNLESPYHRRGNMDDYKEIIFTFDSIDELNEKMDSNLELIVGWFNGDNYEESTREMKVRKMEQGGGVENDYFEKKIDMYFSKHGIDTTTMSNEKKSELIKTTFEGYSPEEIAMELSGKNIDPQGLTFDKGGKVLVVNNYDHSIIDRFSSMKKARDFGDIWLEEQDDLGNKDAEVRFMDYDGWLKWDKIYYPNKYAKGGILADGRILLASNQGIGGNNDKTYQLIKDDRDSDGMSYFELVEMPTKVVVAKGDDFNQVKQMYDMFTGNFAKGGGVSDSDYKTAYKIGIESYKNNNIKAPAQDKKLLDFIYKGKSRPHKEQIKLMEIWTKARYDETEKIMKKEFPELYAKGGSLERALKRINETKRRYAKRDAELREKYNKEKFEKFKRGDAKTFGAYAKGGKISFDISDLTRG